MSVARYVGTQRPDSSELLAATALPLHQCAVSARRTPRHGLDLQPNGGRGESFCISHDANGSRCSALPVDEGNPSVCNEILHPPTTNTPQPRTRLRGVLVRPGDGGALVFKFDGPALLHRSVKECGHRGMARPLLSQSGRGPHAEQWPGALSPCASGANSARVASCPRWRQRREQVFSVAGRGDPAVLHGSACDRMGRPEQRRTRDRKPLPANLKHITSAETDWVA